MAATLKHVDIHSVALLKLEEAGNLNPLYIYKRNNYAQSTITVMSGRPQKRVGGCWPIFN